MSNAEGPAANNAQTAPNTTARKRRIALIAGLAVVMVSMGYAVGVRSPWTAHHPSVVNGTAHRFPANIPMGYFDPDDSSDDGSDSVAFRLDGVVWKAGNKTDEGSVPPCLRDVGARVSVQIGLIEVRRPYGSGSYQQVLSVTCPE